MVSLCLNYLALAHPTLDFDERIQHLRDSLEVAMRHGRHECTADAYTHLAETRYWLFRWEGLDDCLAAGARFTAEHGLWANADHIETYRCLPLMRRGDWAGTQAGFDANRRRADDTEVLHMVNEACAGRIAARRGSPEAESMVVRAWRRANGRRGLLLALAHAGLADAEWGWLAGQPHRAAEVREVFAPYAEHAGIAAPVWGELLGYAARAGLLAEPFDGCPEPWAATLRGDWRAAADAWERLGDPYERGPNAGRVRCGRAHSGGAADTGRPRRRRRADPPPQGPRRAAVPHGPSNSTRTNPAGLTDRQAEVLALLADGLTNAEIAQRLVLSVRTVDHHVAAILTRLGVSSRRAAVVAARSRR